MARRNASFQELFLSSLGQAGTTAMQGGKLIGDTNRANAESARADTESKARLGLLGQQTRAATTAADAGALDYEKMMREDTLKKALESSAGAQSQALEGTPTADGHAVDFQSAKKANKDFKQSDRALWNFLNPGSPMNDDQLSTKRKQDETVKGLEVEDKEFGVGEKKLKAGREAAESTSKLASETQSRKESESRIARTKKEMDQLDKPSAGKPPTADQSKVATYGRRVEQSMGEMERLAEGGYDRSGIITGFGSKLPNVMASSEAQQQKQAERNFVNAVLRRESGAVISDQEFANAEKQYFPRSGDSKEVKEQKARNRQQVVQGFQAEAGPAWENVAPVEAPAAPSGGVDKRSLAEQALNDPEATEQEKAAARRILGK